MTTPSQKQFSFGSWISSGSAVVTEVAADSGFDWLLLDLEHGSGTEAVLLEQIRCFRGSNTLPVVRVGSINPALIAKILDWGAKGIMVPHVNTPEEAEICVQAMQYPPRGLRGISRSVRAYSYGRTLSTEDDPSKRPVFLAQIETIEAVELSPAIAAVDGVDVLFIGPADLQLDLKTRPQSVVRDFPSCLKFVAEASRKAGKKAGILVRDSNDLKSLADLGFTWLAFESDLGLIRAGHQRVLSLFESTCKEP